jgi:hypothetical protein
MSRLARGIGRGIGSMALALLASLSIHALEVKEGLCRIVIDESNARFSLYRLVDVAKDKYEPFFFDQDPRTSHLDLSFEGRQYRLGDSSEFRQAITRIPTGASIEFKSAFARVTQKLEFARSAGGAIPDGIRMTVTVENVSQKDAMVGIRFILDTFLAEKSGVHFRTPTKEKLPGEFVFEGSSFEDWVRTPGDNADFMVVFQGEGYTKPDRVHFANWKRINEATWTLDASTARNFTLLPYSVNDSALSEYWNARSVGKGSSMSVVIGMGAFNPKGYPPSVAGSDSDTSALFSKTVLSQQGTGDTRSLISGDLLSVRDLLSRIDLVLSSGTIPGQDEIAAWKKILDLLEERKKAY